MAYTKRNWVNNETELTAANLNSLEVGVEAASVQAEAAAVQASEAQQSIADLSGTVRNISDSLDTDLPDIKSQLAINRENINTVDAALSKQLGWNQDIEQYYNDLAGTVDLNHASTLEHVQAKNPHNITAEQVGTYTKQEIDTKLRPVETISNTFNDYEDFECPNISKFPHNLRLEIKKVDESQDGLLWVIGGIPDWQPDFSLDGDDGDEEGDPYAVAPLADWGDPTGGNENPKNPISGYAELFTGSNASATWQPLDLGIPGGTVITSADLQLFQQLPTIYQPASRTAGCIEFDTTIGPDYPEVVLALVNNNLKKHFLISLGSDLNIRYVIKNDKLFVQREEHADKYQISIPENTEFYALLLKSGTFNAVTVNYDTCVPILDYFTLFINDNSGQVAYSELYQEGTYLIPYTPSSPIPQDFEVTGYFSQNGDLQDLFIEYSLSYFKADSELGSILSLSNSSSSSNSELGIPVEDALQKLINVGIADPDSSTPGLFYFKYLP